MRFLATLVLACAAGASCTPEASDSSSAELPSSEELAGSRLKRARRASFVISNATAIQGALFSAAMGGPIEALATELGKKLVGEGGKGVEEPEAQKLVDLALKAPDKAVSSVFEALAKRLGDPFKGAKEGAKVELARRYNHKVLQRGVKIAEERPKGLAMAPLSRKLKAKELERYVVLLSIPDPKQKDVLALQKHFGELAKWLEETTERAKEDQELAKAVEALGYAPPPVPAPDQGEAP